jgi:carbamate kinase
MTMRVVVALGGNALLRRGQPLTAENQRTNARAACRALAPLALEHDLVISHGNGPQVGLLALEAAAYTEVAPYPMDILGAQTEGMIGYLIQQELGNELPIDVRLASLLTLVEVSASDPAFTNPTKPIGPMYTQKEADALAAEEGWTFKPDADGFRRVVPSPQPARIFGLEPVRWLLEHDCVVICAGGGGIPVMYTDEPVPAGRRLVGVEAVIDKDLASAVLAAELEADALVIVTDVDAVYSDWGTPQQRAIRRATPDALSKSEFAEGSMGPKVKAACMFVQKTGNVAAIGSINETAALLRGQAGTTVALDAAELELAALT